MAAEVIALIGLVCQLAAMLIGGVWFIGSMQTATAELRGTIEHLAVAVSELKDTIKTVEQKQHEHDLRVSLLEKRDSLQ